MRRVPRSLAVAGVVFVTLVVLFAVAAWMDGVRRDRALRRFAQERSGWAAPEIVRIGSLPGPIDESSGLAVSRFHPDVFWTHNDSGDGPVVYAVTAAGAPVVTSRLAGADAIDWEDLSLGPCPPVMGGDRCLYAADVGDNAVRRPAYAIHVAVEPDPSAASDGVGEIPSKRLEFTFPDGPHDTEAVAVAPDGTVTLVTKGRGEPVLAFRLSPGDVARAVGRSLPVVASGPDTLPLVVDWSVGTMVTGAAWSPDGRRLVVRTLNEAYFFRTEDGGRLVQDGAPCFLGDFERQGEAVDFLDDSTLVTTSEAAGRPPAPIHRITC